jgi:hypothetical protein
MQWLVAICFVASLFLPGTLQAQAAPEPPKLENCPAVSVQNCESQGVCGDVSQMIIGSQYYDDCLGCQAVESQECKDRNTTAQKTYDDAVADNQLIPQCALTTGSCTICDIVVLFGKIAQLILSFISSVVILMVVIGGMFWITSAGNAERVDRGKQIILGAFMGGIFVFTGVVIINLTMLTLLGGSNGNYQIVAPFGSTTPWNQFCENPALATPATPATSITSCAKAANGTHCEADGCDDETACICNNEKCVPTCATGTASQYLFKATGMCESDKDFCTQYSPGPNGQPNGIVESRAGLSCPGTLPVCCVVGGDPRRFDSTTGKYYLEWRGN